MASGPFDLSGKVAIVTGGSRGIGFAIATGLARAGAEVVVAARDQARVTEATRRLGARALGLRLDVTDEASVGGLVEATLGHFGRVDVLVNNAGADLRRLPQDHTLRDWNRMVEVNLTGPFLCSKAVYPHMADAGGGKIVNVGSLSAIFGGDWVPAYSAAKGGLVQLTKSLAIAWAGDNIQVNAVLPGFFHTDLTASIKTEAPDRYDLFRTRIPRGRWGEPDEIAGSAVFLASRASDYVTGVALPVDGGYSAF